MEKLNELAELARLCDSMKSSVDANAAYANFICRIEPKDITAIAEAFRELEQRAEAAEAKLAELDKQEESRWNTHDGIARPIGVDKDDLVYLRMKRQEIKLPYPAGMVNWKHDGGEFDVIAWASVYSSPRPAPAADLAELVPGEMTKSLASIANEYQTSPQNALFIVVGWNACRAAILRNIEEAR